MKKLLGLSVLILAIILIYLSSNLTNEEQEVSHSNTPINKQGEIITLDGNDRKLIGRNK